MQVLDGTQLGQPGAGFEAGQTPTLESGATQMRVEAAPMSLSLTERLARLICFLPYEVSSNTSEWRNHTRTNDASRVPRFNHGLPWDPPPV